MLPMCLFRSYISCRLREKWACSLLCTSLASPRRVVKDWRSRETAVVVPHLVGGVPHLVGGVPGLEHGVGSAGQVVLHVCPQPLAPGPSLWDKASTGCSYVSQQAGTKCHCLCQEYHPFLLNF